LKAFWQLLVAGFLSLTAWGVVSAQEDFQTPSQRTKEAMGKLNKAPAAFGKALQDLKEAAGAKLKAAGGKVRTDAEAESSDLSGPQKKSDAAAAERVSPTGKRDPFSPPKSPTKSNPQPRENLSPLERVEWGQINLVGIVWDVQEPRALVEVPEAGDTSRGYIVKVGTPIGTSAGKVKAITRNEMIVEEVFTDFSGAKKKREVRKKLPTE
jgi:type IV pilus assembly protein PilP